MLNEEQIKLRIKKLKERKIRVQDEKIKATETKNKPAILTDTDGNKNVEDAVEEAVIANCDFLIYFIDAKIESYEDCLNGE